MTSAPTPSALHQALRAATKIPHHTLDHHPLLAPLVRPDLRIDQYADALCALHGVHHAAEQWVLEYLARHPCALDYHARRKLPALEADLAVLGCTPCATQGGVDAPYSVGTLVGILYTLEGSTLGGQFIAGHLRQVHGDSLPMQFFTGYGERTRPHWDAFLQFAQCACPEAEYAWAAQSAVAMFDFIQRHLDYAQAQLAKRPVRGM